MAVDQVLAPAQVDAPRPGRALVRRRWRWLLVPALAGSALCGAAAVQEALRPRQAFAPLAALPPGAARVQLRLGALPGVLGPFAVHPWFVAWDARIEEWRCWEVWQDAAPSEMFQGDWGHLRERRPGIHDWWPCGQAWVEREWEGEEAARLLAVLIESPRRYPHRRTYRYVPGPNSNTFAAWVLEQAGVEGGLPARAVGKDYGWGETRAVAAWSRLDAPLLGAALGPGSTLELHLLGFTAGARLWPPALILPTGELGVPAGE